MVKTNASEPFEYTPMVGVKKDVDGQEYVYSYTVYPDNNSPWDEAVFPSDEWVFHSRGRDHVFKVVEEN